MLTLIGSVLIVVGEPQSNSVKDTDTKKKKKGAKAADNIEEVKEEGAEAGDGES